MKIFIIHGRDFVFTLYTISLCCVCFFSLLFTFFVLLCLACKRSFSSRTSVEQQQQRNVYSFCKLLYLFSRWFDFRTEHNLCILIATRLNNNFYAHFCWWWWWCCCCWCCCRCFDLHFVPSIFLETVTSFLRQNELNSTLFWPPSLFFFARSLYCITLFAFELNDSI